jgi:integrase
VREAEELRQALAAGAKLTYENGSTMRPLSPGQAGGDRQAARHYPQTVAYHVSRLRTKRESGRRGASIDRHAIMATLGCAGLRAHELCDLNVEDADIVHERLNVRDAKTPKGVRLVYTTPKLKGVLASYLGRRGGAVGDPLFPTETGARRTPDNLRQRVFHPVIAHARAMREARGHPPLPDGITPHTLRRTYCSLWLEADPPAPIPWLTDQVGHEKPDTLLRIYAQVMQRDRAKIGWAFDALMAGAALPDRDANGQTNGQTDEKSRRRSAAAAMKEREESAD